LMREVGRMSGRFEFAEGWRRHNHLGLCGAEDDPLRHSLANYVLGDT
jgi:N-acetylglucosamine malate deacetylase 1